MTKIVDKWPHFLFDFSALAVYNIQFHFHSFENGPNLFSCGPPLGYSGL